MKDFHFKTKDLKSIAIVFEAINTCLKNITTASFCSADISEKIFVENFELDVIDIEVDDFVEIDVIFEKSKMKRRQSTIFVSKLNRLL